MRSIKRKYNSINSGDDVKIFTKGKGNYTSRKETVSRWSAETCKVTDIGHDITMSKYYVLEGLTKHYLRHELLLIIMTIWKRIIIRHIITL